MATATKTKEQIMIDLLKKKGTITLKARYGKTQGAFVACPVKDPITGNIRGAEPMSDDDKKKQIRVVDQNTTRLIKDGVTFSQKNPVDVIDWAWLVYNKEIALNRKEAWKDEIILFFIDDVEAEIEEKLSREELILDASYALKKMSQDARTNICRLLGISVSHMTPKEISSFLYDKAKTMPEKVIALANDSEADIKILIMDFVDNKIITKDDETGVFLYGSIKLGSKTESVISWINDPENADLVKEMRSSLLPI